MLLESRLDELVSDGSRRDAAELATAALKNDEVLDVSVGSDTVTVETRRFRGVHEVRHSGGRPAVVQQGEYEVKGDLAFTFTTATMHDDALDAARAELGATDGPDVASDAAAADAMVAAATDVTGASARDAATAPDGGSEPVDDRDGVVSRLAATVRSFVT